MSVLKHPGEDPCLVASFPLELKNESAKIMGGLFSEDSPYVRMVLGCLCVLVCVLHLSLVFYSYSDAWNTAEYSDEQTASKYPGNVYADDEDERFTVQILDKGFGIPRVKCEVR